MLVALLLFYAACVFFTAWITYRVARGTPVHWGWKVLSVPASLVAFATLTFLLGIAVGWSGEQVLRRMTGGGLIYMVFHALAIFWGGAWARKRLGVESPS